MALAPSVLRFKFDGFMALPAEPSKYVASKHETDGGGNPWQLRLKFGGEEGGDSDDPWIAIYLYLRKKKTLKLHAKPTFIVRDAHGNIYCEQSSDQYLFEAGGKSWGRVNFVKRSQILNKENDILVDGALLIDVLLQIKPETDYLHVTSNLFRTNMLKLLENDDDADVTFKVERTTIHAHRLILKMNAPVLFDFCAGRKEGTPIAINDTTPDNFRIILRYVYGGEAPNSTSDDLGKDLIIAADRYAIQGLKLAVGTMLVQALMLNRNNVAEWLLFADAYTCALLKEHAILYVMARAADLMSSGWLEELNGSPKLRNELVVEMANSLTKDSRFDETGRNMSVNELRKSLGEKGLDVDGSKAMLVSRLQGSNKRQRTE